MSKQQVIRIIMWSTVALIIPALGELFVEGWHWGVREFTFAWVFFNALGFTFTFVTNRIHSRALRYAVGAGIVLAFAFVWGMLATG